MMMVVVEGKKEGESQSYLGCCCEVLSCLVFPGLSLSCPCLFQAKNQLNEPVDAACFRPLDVYDDPANRSSNTITSYEVHMEARKKGVPVVLYFFFFSFLRHERSNLITR